MSLVSTVREAARRFGDRPAFVAAAGWALSYAELDAISDEVAAGLARGHDIGNGDLVALTLPSSPDYVVAYVAVAKLGAELVKRGDRVLSHCGVGLNRSALMVALILRYLGMDGNAAVARCRERRPGALYNEVFADYLLSGLVRPLT